MSLTQGRESSHDLEDKMWIQNIEKTTQLV